MREWTSTEIDLCLQSVPELRRLETYGDFNLDRKFDAAAWRMIVVVQKRSPEGSVL
jgi:hypothetical protein